MTRTILFVVFSTILLAMLAVTTYASLDSSIFNVRPPLTSDPWFHATLADAYFGFLTAFAWVAYKEQHSGESALVRAHYGSWEHRHVCIHVDSVGKVGPGAGD